MLTDHPVTFGPIDFTDAAALEMHDYFLTAVLKRAEALGATKELNLNKLTYGMGLISGKIPMICFSEVQAGRDLLAHYLNFGTYGVVVSRAWLESNGGDRVLYTGPNSAVTQRLHRLFIDHQVAGIHADGGELLFNDDTLKPILDLLAYVQGRNQLIETEWRIAGEHGFTGGLRTSGERIALPLDAIEAVLVHKIEDKVQFEDILKSLDGASTAARLPPVLCQPPHLPPPAVAPGDDSSAALEYVRKRSGRS
ncbi:abortive phage resistance protein AbiGi (putative antitoxin) [Paraburkholderia sp. BL17N1]|nr:abortive phage resistance protein AbiGi (putative antitoxin) [Paraburkholderia sp. BL17N1]